MGKNEITYVGFEPEDEEEEVLNSVAPARSSITQENLLKDKKQFSLKEWWKKIPENLKKLKFYVTCALLGGGIFLASSAIGTYNREQQQLEENCCVRSIKLVTDINGLNFRTTPDNTDDKNIICCLPKGTIVYEIYGPKIDFHNKTEFETIKYGKYAILGKNGTKIIGWAAEESRQDNLEFWKPSTEHIENCIAVRTNKVIHPEEIYTGEKKNIAYNSRVVIIEGNQCAYITPEKDIEIVEIDVNQDIKEEDLRWYWENIKKFYEQEDNTQDNTGGTITSSKKFRSTLYNDGIRYTPIVPNGGKTKSKKIGEKEIYGE